MKTKITLILALLSLSGCVDLSPNTLQGKYEGTWSKKGSLDALPVHATIVANSDETATASLVGPSSKPDALKVQFEKTGKTSAALTITGKITAELSLKWNSSRSSKTRPCLSSDEGELCFSDDELVFSFKDAAGIQNTVAMTKVPEGISTLARGPTTPKVYTLMELLDLANQYDFATRIEYQRYLESRFNAKAAALSLLPHISLGGQAGLLDGFTLGSALGMVGDLVPFLLPTRWLQKKEAKIASKAEHLSEIIIRLNAVLYTESLAYNYFRDLRAVKELGVQRKIVNKIFQDLVMREKLGQIAYGSSQDIAAIMNSIDQSVLALEKAMEDELESISLSVGFTNPRAVLAIAVDKSRSVQQPSALTEESIIRAAVLASHEIQQSEYMIEIAQTKKIETYFTWLDPSAATPQLALGAALFPATKSAQAQIKEFQTIKEQTVAQLTNKASGIFATKQYAVKNEKLALEANQIQASRVKRMLDQLRLGTNFALADLVNALQDQVTSKVAEIGNAALYQVTEAQLDRLMLRGVYRQFDSQPENVSPNLPQEP